MPGQPVAPRPAPAPQRSLPPPPRSTTAPTTRPQLASPPKPTPPAVSPTAPANAGAVTPGSPTATNTTTPGSPSSTTSTTPGSSNARFTPPPGKPDTSPAAQARQAERQPVGGSTAQPKPGATPSEAAGGSTAQPKPGATPSEAAGGSTAQPKPGATLSGNTPEPPQAPKTHTDETNTETHKPHLEVKDGEVSVKGGVEATHDVKPKPQTIKEDAIKRGPVTDELKKERKEQDEAAEKNKGTELASVSAKTGEAGGSVVERKTEGTTASGAQYEGAARAMTGKMSAEFSGSLTTQALDVHGKVNVDASLLQAEGKISQSFPFEFPPGSGNKYEAKVTLSGKGDLGAIHGGIDFGLHVGRDGKVTGSFKADGFAGFKGELGAQIELLREGKQVASIEAGAHGTVGVEGSLGAKAGFKDGKFYAYGDISGAAGVGFGTRFNVEADAGQLAAMGGDVFKPLDAPGAIRELQAAHARAAELEPQVRFNAAQVHGQEAVYRSFGVNSTDGERFNRALNRLTTSDYFNAISGGRDRISQQDLLRAQDNPNLPESVRAAAHILGQTPVFSQVSNAEGGHNWFTQRDLDRVRTRLGLGTWGGEVR